MSADAYARIAERYLVPALDDDVVERFFLDVAPALSREEREAIVAELQRENDAPAVMLGAADLPRAVPTFPIDEAPPVAQPNALAQLVGDLSAAVEKRISQRLDRVIAETLSRTLEELAGRDPAARRVERSTGGHPPHVADLLPGGSFMSADADETVRAVARRMIQGNVEIVAVLDEGRFVGVFSQRDILVRVVADGLDPDQTPVKAVMTRQVVVAEPNDEIDSTLRKMQQIGTRSLPVVEEGKIIGIISIRDLLEPDDADKAKVSALLSGMFDYER